MARNPPSVHCFAYTCVMHTNFGGWCARRDNAYGRVHTYMTNRTTWGLPVCDRARLGSKPRQPTNQSIYPHN